MSSQFSRSAIEGGGRSAPLGGAGRAAARQFYEFDRRHHRQRRTPEPAEEPGRRSEPYRMGHRRLCAGLRARPPALRTARRHRRPHADVPHRRGRLHHCLRRLWPRSLDRVADRCARAAGPRRRHHDAAGARHRDRHLSARGARPVLLAVRPQRRSRGRRRTDRWRRAHRRPICSISTGARSSSSTFRSVFSRSSWAGSSSRARRATRT